MAEQRPKEQRHTGTGWATPAQNRCTDGKCWCWAEQPSSKKLLDDLRYLPAIGRPHQLGELCHRAAEEIERLTRERDEARAMMRIERNLSDEIERLRAALRAADEPAAAPPAFPPCPHGLAAYKCVDCLHDENKRLRHDIARYVAISSTHTICEHCHEELEPPHCSNPNCYENVDGDPL